MFDDNGILIKDLTPGMLFHVAGYWKSYVALVTCIEFLQDSEDYANVSYVCILDDGRIRFGKLLNHLKSAKFVIDESTILLC